MFATSTQCRRCARHLFAPRPWMADAECRGMNPDLFLPNRGDSNGERNAKAVCHACPVRSECLEYALAEHIQIGIYGGTSAKQRRTIARQRGEAA